MARNPPVVRSRTPASTMTTEARAWAPPPPEPITWAAAIAFFTKHVDHGERETIIRRGAEMRAISVQQGLGLTVFFGGQDVETF